MYDDYDDYEPPKRRRRKTKAKEASPMAAIVTLAAFGVGVFKLVAKRWPWEKASISTLTQHTLGQVSRIRALTQGGR